MTSKNKKTTIDENATLDNINTLNKKFKIIILLFIIGVAVLASLYINFQSTYKLGNVGSKIDKSASKSVITNVSKEALIANKKPTLENINSKLKHFNKSNSILQQEKSNNKEEVEETHLDVKTGEKTDSSQAETKTLDVSDSPKEKNEGGALVTKQSTTLACLDLLNFMQHYYAMRVNIENGEDFTDPLLELTQYIIHSDQLKLNLVNLLHLTHGMYDLNYFQLEFKDLIRDIYKESDSFLPFNLSEYFFIRKIGKRAMKDGGLDKTIFLIEKALNDNDFVSVYNNLKTLPQNIKSLDEFRYQIEDKLLIEESLSNIENILFNESNCNIVSK